LDEEDFHDSPRVVVGGKQYLDGCIERWCVIQGINGGSQLTAEGCRRLGAFLLNAADGLDLYEGNP
jgi:hypothetical protein